MKYTSAALHSTFLCFHLCKQFIGVECESLMLGFPKTSPSSAHDPVCPPSFCFMFRGVHFRQHLPRFHDCIGSIPSYIPTLESFCRRCVDVGLSLLYTFIQPSPPTSHPRDVRQIRERLLIATLVLPPAVSSAGAADSRHIIFFSSSL